VGSSGLAGRAGSAPRLLLCRKLEVVRPGIDIRSAFAREVPRAPTVTRAGHRTCLTPPPLVFRAAGPTEVLAQTKEFHSEYLFPIVAVMGNGRK
jgi:hypothetical protein